MLVDVEATTDVIAVVLLASGIVVVGSNTVVVSKTVVASKTVVYVFQTVVDGTLVAGSGAAQHDRPENGGV